MAVKNLLFWISTIAIVCSLSPVMGGHGRKRSPRDTVLKSIAPVADCKGDLVDIGSEIRRCYIQCEGYSEPKKGLSLGIYASSAKGPDVLECRKLRMEQSFTQTWTFSTISGELRLTQLDITLDECKSARDQNCPAGNCNVREPDSIPPEYHYASTTTVSVDVITLLTAESALWYSRGVEYISPIGSTESFLSSDREKVDNKVAYIWGNVNDQRTCPYDVIGIYGCDEFDEGENLFYSCSGGDITVTPRHPPLELHDKICPGAMVSEEGFIYRLEEAKLDSDKRGRLAIDVSEGTAEAADTTYLRHKVQQVATRLSSDICFTQCELLSLEVRTSNKSEHLVRIGNRHYLYYPNGTAQICLPTHGCKLPENIAMCGSPPRVSIACNGKTRFWNPVLPYITPGGVCHKPDHEEQLEFLLGSSKYNVDKDLTIQLNKTQYHGIYQNEFMRYHNGRLSLKVDELRDLGKKWKAAKEGPVSNSKIEARSKKIDSPHISIGAWVTGAVSGFFSSIHTLESIIGLALILFVLVLTIKLILIIMNVNNKSARFKQTRYERANDHEMAPTLWM
ncbi:TPA_asm: G [Ficus alphacytorhabdovirus 1]|nr:TPA_asm: G [Ficus alphacytorhabdovirus 1]